MKQILKMITLLIAVFALTATTPTIIIHQPLAQAAQNKGKVAINYEKAVIALNKSIKLKLSGVSGAVTWKSSKSSVAVVDKSGVVTGKNIGNATITATVGKNTYRCVVTVNYNSIMTPYEHTNHYSADFLSSFDLIELDMNSTFEDFNSVGFKITGIYALVHSEEMIYIEGFDKQGKSLGMVKSKGLSYLEFDKGTKLTIMNPDKILYTIDFVPVKPTVIMKKGYYTYEDLIWYKLKDGNILAPIIIEMPNSYIEYVTDTEEESKSASASIGETTYTPHDTGYKFDPDMMGAGRTGYFMAQSANQAGELTNLKLYFDQYQVYFDDKDIYVYGKRDLTFPDGYKQKIFDYQALVKKLTEKKYLPDQTIWDKALRIRYTYEARSSAGKDYLCMNMEDTPETYFHEMTHYYHLENMDYGCQISAWTEGIAQVAAEDSMIAMGLDAAQVSSMMSHINRISEKDLKDFEKYFLNVGYNDCYNVGYNFIRFIQKEYGDDIVYKINKNIQKKVPKPEWEAISSDNRNPKSDELFLQVIKDTTSKDVFTRFVDEVVRKIMTE